MITTIFYIFLHLSLVLLVGLAILTLTLIAGRLFSERDNDDK